MSVPFGSGTFLVLSGSGTFLACRSLALHLRDEFGAQVLEAIRDEAARRTIDLKDDILPNKEEGLGHFETIPGMVQIRVTPATGIDRS